MPEPITQAGGTPPVSEGTHPASSTQPGEAKITAGIVPSSNGDGTGTANPAAAGENRTESSGKVSAELSSPGAGANKTPDSQNDLLLKRLGVFLIPAVLVILSLVAIVVGMAFWFVGNQASHDLTGQILIVYLVQVGIGALMGVFCILIGSIMCWYGVADVMNIKGELVGGKMSIQSARIGTVLLIGGVLLTALSLHKSADGSVTHEETKSHAKAAKDAAATAEKAVVKVKDIETRIRAEKAENVVDDDPDTGKFSKKINLNFMKEMEEVKSNQKTAIAQHDEMYKRIYNNTDIIHKKSTDMILEIKMIKNQIDCLQKQISDLQARPLVPEVKKQ